jgi:hypothetical protein
MSVTNWVQAALAVLGPDATVREVTDYILRDNPTLPPSYVALALYNLRMKSIRAARKKSQRKQPPANPWQGEFDFSD